MLGASRGRSSNDWTPEHTELGRFTLMLSYFAHAL